MEVLTPSGNKTNLVSVSWSPDGQQLIAGRRREDQDLDHHEARATPLKGDGWIVDERQARMRIASNNDRVTGMGTGSRPKRNGNCPTTHSTRALT